jgi:hypothetical protein
MPGHDCRAAYEDLTKLPIAALVVIPAIYAVVKGAALRRAAARP